jgi:DNA-binding NarL/FixJ family response regulator
MAYTTRILVVESSNVIATGLTALIGKKKDFHVCGEAKNGRDAVTLVNELKPDLVLMDMAMPQLDGIAACRLIREQQPDVKIIMMTKQVSESEIFQALTAGADGYCLKESTIEKLYKAIRTVAEGDFWLDSTIARKVVKTLLETMSALGGEPETIDDKQQAEDESLSRRELAVLNLVAQGLSNQEIAQHLNISVDAVKSRIRKIMKKLVVKDRTQAVVKALRQGLI